MPRSILCVNTGGAGDLHGLRMRRLAERLPDTDLTFYDFDKTSRREASRDLMQVLRSRSWDLVYQESTGIGSGARMIQAARSAQKQRYVVSSGDPISGFFKVTKGPAFAAPFAVYEKMLYRYSAGFIGWTPYLTGRALELGAPRAVSVEGAVALDVFRPLPVREKQAWREAHGIAKDHLVCGLVGSLTWVERQNYSYGLELVETLKRVKRADVSVLIVGDGGGRERLEKSIPVSLRERVIFTGRIPEAEVVHAMNAMDIGFIPQSVDELGSYRLTTKMPEYLACGLPIAMSPVPGFFDYVGSAAGWALPPFHPADVRFHEQCAAWIDTLARDEITQKAACCRAIAESRFSYEVVGPRFASFVESVLA